MTLHSLEAQLQEQIELNSAITQSIFGTTSIRKIAALLDSYCNQQFEQEITACSFAHLSVGATFVVHLGNQQVVLKAYGDRHPLPALLASFRIQRSLTQTGFPCPDVLSLPQSEGETILTAQSVHLDPYAQAIASGTSTPEQLCSRLPSTAHIRRTMAQQLAELIQQCKSYALQDLPEWMELSTAELWHTPHNALFDFEDTKQGAEWIDNVARQAKQQLRAVTGPLVVGHSDWSLQNMSFTGQKLACVYDWDALRIGLEPCFVGGAARVYRHDWRIGAPKPAISVAEIKDFVSAYEAARGWPFTAQEYQTIGAAVVYTAAYGLRCAHAVRETDRGRYERAMGQLRDLVDCFLPA